MIYTDNTAKAYVINNEVKRHHMVVYDGVIKYIKSSRNVYSRSHGVITLVIGGWASADMDRERRKKMQHKNGHSSGAKPARDMGSVAFDRSQPNTSF